MESSRVTPTWDSTQDVMNVTGGYKDRVLYARFTRKRDTGDSNDFLLTDGQQPYVILAWDGYVYAPTGAFSYHGSTNRQVSGQIEFRPCCK